jgi:hypothetical protein
MSTFIVGHCDAVERSAQQSLEGSVMHFWVGASGAERLCALGASGS